MRTAIAAVALTAAALPLLAAAPASAEQFGIDDPKESTHGSDLIALQVRNGAENVDVTTMHADLRRAPATGSAGTIYVDTDRDDRGPEYVFVGGFYAGTDYRLLETEGFGKAAWGDPIENGDYIMRVSYDKDRVRIRMSRAALGNPDDVRVAVRISGTRAGGGSVVDWAGKPRSFTPWLAQG
ncbi:hypothetical protein [Nocardioides sp.]|uniref:hypothetical protein n=1 Tax=Nocardioides sp. TaxID=35761 RepID=UPI0025E657AF|nr:hypothetical protein [Nocardioides sp.]